MSDGPHRSLPMRQGWRNLAERADRCAFEPEQVADAVPEALGDDWREEGCDEIVRDIRAVLGDGRQPSLFAGEKQDALDALKKLSGAGYQLRRLVLDSVVQAVDDGFTGTDALVEGAANALAIRCGAGVRQVEEHYLRKSTDNRAANVRQRIEKSGAMSDFKGIARRFLKIDGSSSATPAKKQLNGLDDGVRF
jgi:hypothetical protein